MREQLLINWLEKHHTADVLVVDPRTGEPAYAEYTTLQGIPRRYPVRFPWPEEWMRELSCFDLHQ